MNNYQDILESYDKIYNLSVMYTGTAVNQTYKDIEMIYTDAGIPYIEMYPGDKIEIEKSVFVNANQIYGEFTNKNNFTLKPENSDIDGLLFEANINTITAIVPGRYQIKSDRFGLLDYSNYNINNINDPDILVIVKEVPQIKEIKWNFGSDLLLVEYDNKNSFRELDIKLKLIYSDGTIKEIKYENESFNFVSTNFIIKSDNSLVAEVIAQPVSGSSEAYYRETIKVYPYNDQCKISIKLKETSTLTNVKLPKDLQLISYNDENDIEKIKQAVHYIYFLSDNDDENDTVTDKQYYVEKSKSKNLYVKVLNGIFDHGRFEIVDCHHISKMCMLNSDYIYIHKPYSYNGFSYFELSGTDEMDNVDIIMSTVSGYILPQSDNVIFNNVSVIDSISKLTWKINNNKILEITNGTINEYNSSIELHVTDLHNILLNEIICETLSGRTINIESDCVFSSTKKDSLDINEDITVEGNKMTVHKSNECKIIFNGSTKYNLPAILETSNVVNATVVMTKEDIFCNKIELYEKNDSNMNLLNDTEIEMKMLSEKSLYAVVYPDNATYKEVNWFSDDTSVATIDDDGNIKILNAGSANVICTIKYPEPENPEQPDKANDIYDHEYYNPNTGVIEPLGFNPPDISATISINAIKVDVSEISFDRNSITLYCDGEHQPYYVRVKPEGASITDVRVKFISDDENNKFFGIDSDDEMYVYGSGTGKLIAYSVDNPEITAEMTVIGIDTRVKKVTINTAANDTDYEYYDHMNERKTYTTDGEYISVGERVTNEKYDDDDFNRYYLPVNNSMQLSTTVEPADAINKNIKWLSSDTSLVKVNDKGIITAIRYGNQELDVYGDDNISESRFANTVWITAINTKYNKYDVCQVRVTRNKTLAIDIPFTEEHDYDVDDILSDGKYDRNAEHEFDYVIKVGETISIPVSLSTQDTNFGTSDYLTWFYDSTGENIIELSDGHPDHSNREDDFDWTINSPGSVNSNKNNFYLNVKGIGIGDTYIYAKTRDNVRSVGQKQLYVPAESYATEIEEHPGLTGLNTPFGFFTINVYYYSKTNLTIYNIKKQLRDKLNQLLVDTHIEGNAITKVNGVTVKLMENGVNVIDRSLNELIDEAYIARQGVACVGAKCLLNPNGVLKVIVPDKIHIENLKTKGPDSIPLSFDIVPTIDKKAIMTTDENGNETLDKEKVKEYIGISVYNMNENLKTMPVFLDAIYKDNENNLKRQLYTMEYQPWIDETGEESRYVVKAYFPSPIKTDDIVEEKQDPFNARPGTGVWIDGPKSRNVRIRVVATPRKLQIGWINAYNDELNHLNTITTDLITRTKWSSNKYHYMAIGTDDEFKELVNDAETWGCKLAEKYKSFAWFSDNEDVIRFEDVEDLSYRDEDGNLTNNPNESFKERKEETKTITFKNINSGNFTGYRNIGENISIKFGDNYIYNDAEDLYTNNTNLCIVKMHAEYSGRFVVQHTGSIQYADNEQFNNATTLTVRNGYKDSYIDCTKGDTIYVRGNSETIVYIKSIGWSWTGEGTIRYLTKTINDKQPTEYSKYNNVYIKIPDDDSKTYFSSNGITLYDETTAVKYIPKHNGTVTFTFSGGSGIKIYNKTNGSTNSIGSSVSPYTMNVNANDEYIISGRGGAGTVLSKMECMNVLDTGTVGGYKGTVHYTVKPSFMKRVICEGKGTANIYVLSPKGQALIKKRIKIK